MYTGLPFTIPLGGFGLHTDDPQSTLNPGELLIANNIHLEEGKLQVAPGSARYNNSALSAGIVAAFDWWPDYITKQYICLTRDGKVWSLPDIQTQNLIPPMSGQTASATIAVPTALFAANQNIMVSGGAESQGRNRKLFIMTGQDPIQVISGNSLVRYNISKPSPDWGNRNWPSFGLIHHGRLMVWGCPQNPHQAYASNPDDHEDFQTFGGLALNFNVYPGEYERILGGKVTKGRLYWFKYPQGVYYLDDTDPDTNNWAIYKYSDAFGASSAMSACEGLDDMFVASNNGSIISFKAVQYYGGFEMADILKNLRAQKYMRQYMQQDGLNVRQALYYGDRKMAFFTYQSSSGSQSDSMLVLDFNQSNPRAFWYTKDQANCLGLQKSISDPVLRPFYGSEDGYIYLMDQVDRNVGGSAYKFEFMTPNLDFHQMSSFNTGYQTSDMGSKNKHYDSIGIEFEQSGKWDLTLEVFIDGELTQTLEIPMATKRGAGEFVLNSDKLYNGAPDKVIVPIYGMGKTIGFRGYSSNINSDVKITALTVWFRPAAQYQTEDES